MIMKAVFTTLCTLPVIALLDGLFSYLRSPHNRVLIKPFSFQTLNPLSGG